VSLLVVLPRLKELTEAEEVATAHCHRGLINRAV
jgi:hypothetical protein